MKIIKEVRLAIVLLLSSAGVLFATGINSGNPVPIIADDEPSAIFLAGAIAKSQLVDLVDDGIIGKLKKGAKQDWIADQSEGVLEYARRLAKTLSQLTPAEQNIIWYGS